MIADFSSIKILLVCFFCSTTSSCPCSEWYFIVISCRFLWSNHSSIYFFHLTAIFHHYVVLFLYHFLHMFFCLYQPYLYNIFYRRFRIFHFFFHFIILSEDIIYWNKFVMTMYGSIKASKIRTSIVFSLSFPNNTILSCFYSFFFVIYLYFLIFLQIFILISELVIPTGITTNAANAEIETITSCFISASKSKLKTGFFYHIHL